MKRLRKGELPELTGVVTRCKVCEIDKDDSMFKWQGGKRQGLVCRACDLAKKRAAYVENPTARQAAVARARARHAENSIQRRETAKRWRTENNAAIRARRKTYHLENRERINAKTRAWVASNFERHAAKCAEYYRDNIVECNARQAAYYAKNKVRYAIKSAEWRKKNAKFLRAYFAAYEAARKQRVPPWADAEKTREVYAACPAGMQVDHVVPLFGRLVCGLHVHNNLQYLTPVANQRKSNKHDPMEFEKWKDMKSLPKLPPPSPK